MDFILKICLKYLSNIKNNTKDLGLASFPSIQYSALALVKPLERKTDKSQFFGNHIKFLPFSRSSKIKNQQFNMVYVFRLHISQPHSDEITDQMLI